jgi:hypothetical protein
MGANNEGDGILAMPPGPTDDNIVTVKVCSTLGNDVRTAVIAIVSAIAATNLQDAVTWSSLKSIIAMISQLLP